MQIPIHVVLVKSHYSRNVGSVSRVMANMGANRLILVAPECEIDLQARQGAAGAQTHLLEHTLYKTWDDFYKSEPAGVFVAFCARGKKDLDPLPLEERVQHIQNDSSAKGLPLYFVFGPEDHGLENEDLEYAHYICTLPTFGSFKSYNLSHAALLSLYIAKSNLKDEHFTPRASEESFYFPDENIQSWLTELGFTIGERRTDAYKVIKRILLRNLSSPKELRILEAVVQQTIRKLRGG
ncbi:MAG: RNA methyltransferase [Bdellovibrionales bacterium]|nr:RNA methyltransferase [Bdellovibrionales bacterium]